MPELPEVESIVRALRPQVGDKTIIRTQVFDSRLLENTNEVKLDELTKGAQIKTVQRRGKFILFTLNNGWRLTTHLRMTGKYLYFPKRQEPDKHTRLVICFADNSQLHYHDLRRFGQLAAYPGSGSIRAFEKLGPEPLEQDFTQEYLQKKFKKHKTAIKQLLLDQVVVAGIGNIYASEILFAAKISPFRAADQLNDNDIGRIVRETRRILDQAIQCLGTTFSDYRTPGGEKGGFGECLQVYGRTGQPCLRCATPIERLTQAQRSTFFCPACQAK